MITVHKLNGTEVTLNSGLIEAVEGGADTVIVLATGNRYVVRESVEEVVELVAAYQRRVGSGGRPANPIEGFLKK